jgi:Domain of unknown function (DUF4328)
MDGERDRGDGAGTGPGSLGGQARLLLNLLIVTALLVGFAVVYDVSQVATLSRAAAERSGEVDGASSGTEGFGGGFDDAGLGAQDPASGVAALITMLNLATNIAFLVWFRRAYFHPTLPADRLRFRRGLVVLSWFVPILNLVRPKQIMNDIWRASDPAPPGQAGASRRQPVSAVVHAWWALWLVSIVAAWAVVITESTPPTEPLLGAVTYLASDLVGLGWTVAAILLVRRVTRRVALLAATIPRPEPGH